MCVGEPTVVVKHTKNVKRTSSESTSGLFILDYAGNLAVQDGPREPIPSVNMKCLLQLYEKKIGDYTLI